MNRPEGARDQPCPYLGKSGGALRHKDRRPPHNVRLPIHFIAIRLGFCAFAAAECPVIGKCVPKRDRVASLALRATSLAARGGPPRARRQDAGAPGNPTRRRPFEPARASNAPAEGNVPRRGEGGEGFLSGLPIPSLPSPLRGTLLDRCHYRGDMRAAVCGSTGFSVRSM